MAAFSNLQAGFVSSHLDTQGPESFLCPSYPLSLQAFIAGNGQLDRQARRGNDSARQSRTMLPTALLTSRRVSFGKHQMAWTQMQMCSSVQCFGMRGSYRAIRSCRCRASLIKTNLSAICSMYLPALGTQSGTSLHQQIAALPTPFPSHALTCTHEVHAGLCMYSDPAEAGSHASILLLLEPWQTQRCYAQLLI